MVREKQNKDNRKKTYPLTELPLLNKRDGILRRSESIVLAQVVLEKKQNPRKPRSCASVPAGTECMNE